MKAQCRTNLDKYAQVDWPDEFVCCPEKGHRVISKCGQHSLTVVQVSHCQSTASWRLGPSLLIELNK
jgi:hypothetical protein